MKKQTYTATLLAGLAIILAGCVDTPEVEPVNLTPKPELQADIWDEDITVVPPTDVLEEGFYKDALMDGGTYLTSRKRLPACEAYNISLEYFNAEADTPGDSLFQIQKFVGDEMDHNGFLLYPDGKPRFKMFYSCGGKSTYHGRCLGDAGRNAVRNFFMAGGSYQGSCAGMFLASQGKGGVGSTLTFYGIWPGLTVSSGLSKSATGMFIEEDSPLLKYFDFGGDHYVDSVRHNGGGYAEAMVYGSIPLARYDKPGYKMHNEVCVWGWKKNARQGRIVLCGSHPEEVEDGERRELMGAMMMYAMDGRGCAVLKKQLAKGETFTADKDSRDNDPLHAKIGDGQCHHFAVVIPNSAKNIEFRLEYEGDYDIHLLAKKGTFAFESVADHKDLTSANRKALSFDKLESGVWYICVDNESRPVNEVGPNGNIHYTGKTELLNGIAYKLSVVWE